YFPIAVGIQHGDSLRSLNRSAALLASRIKNDDGLSIGGHLSDVVVAIYRVHLGELDWVRLGAEISCSPHHQHRQDAQGLAWVPADKAGDYPPVGKQYCPRCGFNDGNRQLLGTGGDVIDPPGKWLNHF